MKHLLITFFALVYLLACNSQSTPVSEATAIPDKKGIAQKVDALVKEYQDLDIFSGVVLLAENGKPFYHKAFGLADRGNKIANTTKTKFILGSMNKSFTKVVILQMIEEGKLNYADKMVQYLDGFTREGMDQITIRQLLNHRSGFGDYYGPLYFDLPAEKRNIKGITAILQQMDLLFPPGEGDEYSNAGYILLGSIIEKVSGKSYAQNVRERIVKPLGLKETYLENVAQIPDKSIGYLKTVNGLEDNHEFITEPRSDGGFWATAEDVLTFYRSFMYSDELLKASSKAEDGMFAYLKSLEGKPWAAAGMAGGSNGINTVHFELVNEGISIIVLANMDEPVGELLGTGIRAIIEGKTPEKPELPTILNVYNAYNEKGLDHIKTNFAELTKNFHPADPKDLILNDLGYQMLASGKTEKAIELFKLNTELFPEIANCWDSYGEALLESGDQKGALKAYKKALSIRPDLPTAKAAVQKLEN